MVDENTMDDAYPRLYQPNQVCTNESRPIDWLIVLLLILIIGVLIGPARKAKGEWVDVKPVNSAQSTGVVCTDVSQHTNHAGMYADRVTFAHETTHDVNADISSMSYGKHQGLYMLKGRGFRVSRDVKGLTLRDILNSLPFRGNAVQTYLIDARPDYNDTPTYVLNEWVAYMNGCEAGIELGMPARTDYSFDHACQLGLYSKVLAKLSKAEDIGEFCLLGEERMKLIKAHVKVDPDTWDRFINYTTKKVELIKE